METALTVLLWVLVAWFVWPVVLLAVMLICVCVNNAARFFWPKIPAINLNIKKNGDKK